MISALNKTDLISTIEINKTEYDFRVALINPEGKYFGIRYEAIKELVINSALHTYFDDGYIVIDNSYDVLERQPDGVITDSIPYAFRGDSRDILHIEIMPKVRDSGITSAPDEEARAVFCLSYDFAIYNIEDVLSPQANTKHRKLYFWDLWHQIMIEKNTCFSTAELLSGNDHHLRTNIERGIPTGDAIKGLLRKTLSTDLGFNCTFSGFDKGSTNIFFTAPAGFKAEDSLQYLLNLHVSSKENNYDAGILRIESFPRGWSFISLSEYFKQAYDAKNDAGGVLYLERFVIGGNTDQTSTTNFTVVVSRSPKLSIYFADTNIIENFSFLPPAGQFTQQEVVTKVTYNSDPGTGIFSMDVVENDFEKVQQVYYQNYVAPLKGNKGAPASNLIANKLRSTRQNVEHVYSAITIPEQRLSEGRSDTLLKSVLLNNTISFRVKGATYRDAGRFISIDRDSSLPDSAFDHKMLGIYLIVSVKHTFSGGDYYTDLRCVKTYNFTDLGEKGLYV